MTLKPSKTEKIYLLYDLNLYGIKISKAAIAKILNISEKTVRNKLKNYTPQWRNLQVLTQPERDSWHKNQPSLKSGTKDKIGYAGTTSKQNDTYWENKCKQAHIKIQEQKQTIDNYKKSDEMKNKQIKEMEQTLNQFSQEKESLNQKIQEQNTIIEQYKQQREDLKHDLENEQKAHKDDINKLKETHRKELEAAQEKIILLLSKQEEYRIKKHHDFLQSNTFERDSNKTSRGFDWGPVIVGGTIVVGALSSCLVYYLNTNTPGNQTMKQMVRNILSSSAAQPQPVHPSQLPSSLPINKSSHSEIKSIIPLNHEQPTKKYPLPTATMNTDFTELIKQYFSNPSAYPHIDLSPKQMSDIQLIILVQISFEKNGYTVTPINNLHEMNGHLRIEKNRELIIVKVKQQHHNIWEHTIQEMITARNHYRYVTRTIIITTYTFTKSAKAYADMHRIEYWDGKRLPTELNKLWFSSPAI